MVEGASFRPGFDSSRWALVDVYHNGLFRGWRITRDGITISGLFDERIWAETALREFREEARAALREGAVPQADAQ